jgi:hypothetical protein
METAKVNNKLLGDRVLGKNKIFALTVSFGF